MSLLWFILVVFSTITCPAAWGHYRNFDDKRALWFSIVTGAMFVPALFLFTQTFTALSDTIDDKYIASTSPVTTTSTTVTSAPTQTTTVYHDPDTSEVIVVETRTVTPVVTVTETL